MASQHPPCLLCNFPSGHQNCSVLSWRCVMKCFRSCDRNGFKLVNGNVCARRRQILASWVPWVYKVMIRLYESELEFGHVIDWQYGRVWTWSLMCADLKTVTVKLGVCHYVVLFSALRVCGWCFSAKNVQHFHNIEVKCSFLQWSN